MELQKLPTGNGAGVRSDGEAVGFGAGVNWRLSISTLGVTAQARTTLIGFLGGGLPNAMRRAYWDAGLGLEVAVTVWESERLGVGL